MSEHHVSGIYLVEVNGKQWYWSLTETVGKVVMGSTQETLSQTATQFRIPFRTMIFHCKHIKKDFYMYLAKQEKILLLS